MRRAEQSSGRTYTPRLLAIRKAGAAFNSPYNLRSASLEKLLTDYRQIHRRLLDIRDDLLGRLHHTVPRLASRQIRRKLLRIKRDVYNMRPVAPLGQELELPPEHLAALEEYTRVLRLETTLFAEGRDAVQHECRASLHRLLDDSRFRLACRYASPDFEEAIRRETVPPDVFSGIGRGIQAYATKFFSKANPFHMFAEMIFPPAAGIAVDRRHEIVLDTTVILGIENVLLADETSARRSWLYLRPHFRADQRYCFWITPSLRLVSLPASGLLDLLVGFFEAQSRETGKPVATRAACEEYLAAHLPAGHDAAALKALVVLLVQQAVLVEYLITSCDTFASNLSGLRDGAYDRPLKVLQRWHLARVDTPDLCDVDTQLTEAHRSIPGMPSLKYFVNSYDRTGTNVDEAAAAGLFDALSDLKPAFIEHNFSANEYVIRAFLSDYLQGLDERRAPYLVLLRDYMRDRSGIVRRYLARMKDPASGDYRRLAAWRAEIASETGTLTRERLMALTAYPRSRGVRPSLCFNGAFDYKMRKFYIWNVFSGGGHFISRYMLHRQCASGLEPPADGGAKTVELVARSSKNLNYVVRGCETGVGFDTRYAHLYRVWIDPSEIVVELSPDGTVGYRHERSGQRLRFQYRGFLLSQLLPAQYQLLLLDHADVFRNPFLGTGELEDGNDLCYTPGLVYGPVCLRRARWIVRSELLARVLTHDDLLRCAASLREWFHDTLRVETDEWYYTIVDRDTTRPKPLYLDLFNPLSVEALRRAIMPFRRDRRVLLSAMEPPVPHLAHYDGSPFVTELMVEV